MSNFIKKKGLSGKGVTLFLLINAIKSEKVECLFVNIGRLRVELI